MSERENDIEALRQIAKAGTLTTVGGPRYVTAMAFRLEDAGWLAPCAVGVGGCTVWKVTQRGIEALASSSSISMS
jgi:hypothetical protein